MRLLARHTHRKAAAENRPRSNADIQTGQPGCIADSLTPTIAALMLLIVSNHAGGLFFYGGWREASMELGRRVLAQREVSNSYNFWALWILLPDWPWFWENAPPVQIQFVLNIHWKLLFLKFYFLDLMLFANIFGSQYVLIAFGRCRNNKWLFSGVDSWDTVNIHILFIWYNRVCMYACVCTSTHLFVKQRFQ